MHTLIWGNQQPAWIESLPANEQREEIEEWFAAVAAAVSRHRFHRRRQRAASRSARRSRAMATISTALGGAGASGWEWVLECVSPGAPVLPDRPAWHQRVQRHEQHRGHAAYIGIIQLLQAETLIDDVGVQGHAFSTRVSASTTSANLDLLATTGLPIYVTELDIDGPTDEVQLARLPENLPGVLGAPGRSRHHALGLRPGHWRTAQGAYIVLENGAERPAMVWLRTTWPTRHFGPGSSRSRRRRRRRSETDVSFTVRGGRQCVLSRTNGARTAFQSRGTRLH